MLVAVLSIVLLAPAMVLLVEGVRHWPQIPPHTAGHLTATSLAASLAALGIILASGTPLAWGLSHLNGGRRFWAEVILAVPLLLPPLVVGLVLSYLVGPMSLTRLGWTNTASGLVLAEVYEAAPYYVFVAWSGFSAVPRLYREVAGTLGLSPRRTFWRVVLPLAAPSLAVGAAMAWSRAIGAFGAPIVVSYHPEGLPVGVWVVLEEFGLNAALPLALVLVAVALPLPLAALAWSRRVAR